MCIIVISENKPLELASFVDFAVYNQDGAGIMVARDGKVETYVTLDGPAAVHAKYLEMYRKGDPMFLHYRMKTHGAIDLANTHPYLVYRHEDGKELWMMHNGILRTGNAKNVAMSDTWNFIQERLQKLTKEYPKWFMNNELIEWLGDFIGNNRFVFLDSDGDYNIVNASQWSVHDEHCYSNEYAWSAPRKVYTPKKYPAYVPPTKGTAPAYNNVWDFQDGYFGRDDPYHYQHLNADTVVSADEQANLLYAYYDDYAKTINSALPEGAVKGWTPQIVSQLEEYIGLEWFVGMLDTGDYTAEECDTLVKVLDVGDAVEMTLEADELIEDILYRRLDNVPGQVTPVKAAPVTNPAVPATYVSNGAGLKVLK